MDGYKENAQGNLVPIEKIKPVDLLRDDVVMALIEKAREMNQLMTSFKSTALTEVGTFIALSAEQYGAKLGGKKGNVSLRSFDGKFRVQVAISDRIVFDERLQVAKTLIDNCINRWADGANKNLQAIVNDAFQVDKEGRINTSRVLGLRRLDISDTEWMDAMLAISDSVTVDETKEYLRFYSKDEKGRERQIPVDLSSI